MTDIKQKDNSNKNNKEALQLPSLTNITNSFRLKLAANATFRKKHSTYFFLGGLFFIICSLCYLEPIKSYVEGEYTGGYCLFLGTIFVFLSNCIEFNFLKAHFDKNIEYYNKLSKHTVFYDYEGDNVLTSFYQTGMGINYFIPIIAGLINIFGGLCFIPQLNLFAYAYKPLQFANLVFFFCQIWKLLRIYYNEESEEEVELETDKETPLLNEVNISNLKAYYKKTYKEKEDFSFFAMVDVFYGLYGLVFCYTLCKIPICTEEELNFYTELLGFSGVLLVISASFLINQYFYRNKYLTSGIIVDTEETKIDIKDNKDNNVYKKIE